MQSSSPLTAKIRRSHNLTVLQNLDCLTVQQSDSMSPHQNRPKKLSLTHSLTHIHGFCVGHSSLVRGWFKSV